MPSTTAPSPQSAAEGTTSQVRKRERNYTVIGLGYTSGPENPCKTRHQKKHKASQVRKHERNHTVIGLGYTSGLENPCKTQHQKKPKAVTHTTKHYLGKHTSYSTYTSQPIRCATHLTLDQRSMSNTSHRSETRN
ncbi:hypothetical protein Taro_051658 [Colocasia esculenta]|uniref:Uncharacterized protein n=1 Tax=Colocasia esculenta TaxID=4460 RepID=A0A843XHP7_COLES|nr:hypothetical protein [Colocasia esculenta]